MPMEMRPPPFSTGTGYYGGPGHISTASSSGQVLVASTMGANTAGFTSMPFHAPPSSGTADFRQEWYLHQPKASVPTSTSGHDLTKDAASAKTNHGAVNQPQRMHQRNLSRNGLLMERAQLIADTSAALLSAHISRQPPPGLRSAPLTPLASPHAPSSPMAGPFAGHSSSLGSTRSSGEYPYAGSLATPYFSCELPPNFAAGGPVAMPKGATSPTVVSNVSGMADPLYARASKGVKVPLPPPPTAAVPLAGVSVPPPLPPPPVGGLRLAFMQQQQLGDVQLPGTEGGPPHLPPPINAPPPGAASSLSPTLDMAPGMFVTTGIEGVAPGSGQQPDLATLHMMSTIAATSVVSGVTDISPGQRVYASNAAEAAILAAVSAFPHAPNPRAHEFPPSPNVGELLNMTTIAAGPVPGGLAAPPHPSVALPTFSGVPPLGVPFSEQQGLPLATPGQVPVGLNALPNQSVGLPAVPEVASLGVPFSNQPDLPLATQGQVPVGLTALPDQPAAPPAVSGVPSVGFPVVPPGGIALGTPVSDDAGHIVSQQGLVACPPQVVLGTVADVYAAPGAPGYATSTGNPAPSVAPAPHNDSLPMEVVTAAVATSAAESVLEPPTVENCKPDPRPHGSSASPFSNESVAGSNPSSNLAAISVDTSPPFPNRESVSSPFANASMEDAPEDFFPDVVSQGQQVMQGPNDAPRLTTPGSTFTPYPSLATPMDVHVSGGVGAGHASQIPGGVGVGQLHTFLQRLSTPGVTATPAPSLATPMDHEVFPGVSAGQLHTSLQHLNTLGATATPAPSLATPMDQEGFYGVSAGQLLHTSLQRLNTPGAPATPAPSLATPMDQEGFCGAGVGQLLHTSLQRLNTPGAPATPAPSLATPMDQEGFCGAGVGQLMHTSLQRLNTPGAPATPAPSLATPMDQEGLCGAGFGQLLHTSLQRLNTPGAPATPAPSLATPMDQDGSCGAGVGQLLHTSLQRLNTPGAPATPAPSLATPMDQEVSCGLGVGQLMHTSLQRLNTPGAPATPAPSLATPMEQEGFCGVSAGQLQSSLQRLNTLGSAFARAPSMSMPASGDMDVFSAMAMPQGGPSVSPTRRTTAGVMCTPYPSLAGPAESEMFFRTEVAQGMQPASSGALGSSGVHLGPSNGPGLSGDSGDHGASPLVTGDPPGLKGDALSEALQEAKPEPSRAESVANRADFLADAANAIAQAAQVVDEPQKGDDHILDMLPTESEVLQEIIGAAVDVAAESAQSEPMDQADSSDLSSYIKEQIL